MWKSQALKFALPVVLALLAGEAHAAETWLCEDENGHRYQVSQNVPSDSCRELSADELTLDPASFDLPKKVRRANSAWVADKFCSAQKSNACRVTDSAEQHGELNGVWFVLFSDSAAVASSAGTKAEHWLKADHWDISCSRDKMTSARSCYVTKGDLYIFVKSDGRLLVSVGDEHFPNSQTSLKVGSKRFDTTQRDGFFANGKQIVAAMRNGTPVVTRYMKWPYRSWVDAEFDAYGVETAVQVARWLIKKGDFK